MAYNLNEDFDIEKTMQSNISTLNSISLNNSVAIALLNKEVKKIKERQDEQDKIISLSSPLTLGDLINS